MLPAYRMPGNVFDEGSLLVYPLQVLDGAVPHRDFETFYGPGNPWLLAAVYELAGATHAVERTVGLAYQLLAVLSLLYLCLPFGRVVAGSAAALAAVVLVPFELEALATVGALAAALAQLAVLARARRRGGEGSVLPLVAGALAGIGFLMRPDFLPALALSSVPLLLGSGPQAWRRYGLGLGAGLTALAVHAAVVGPEKLDKLVSDLVASGPARRLPVEWTASEPGRLLIVTLVALAATLLVGLWTARSERSATPARALLALGLLSAALLPYALSRLDWTHLGITALPVLGAIPAAAARVAGNRGGPREQLVGAAAAAGLFGLLIVLAPRVLEAPLREQLAHLRGTAGDNSDVVRVDGRSFRVGAGAPAREARRVVAAAEAARRQGARRLFVGPRDLRRTPLNDMFLYYLLADFEPASYYVELNPRTANRAGSGLARDLRRADVLILNRFWDSWNEPNESRRFGPNEPNRVVERHFCPLLESGRYTVLRRCRKSSARRRALSSTANSRSTSRRPAAGSAQPPSRAR
jgi:hypothetical protein